MYFSISERCVTRETFIKGVICFFLLTRGAKFSVDKVHLTLPQSVILKVHVPLFKSEGGSVFFFLGLCTSKQETQVGLQTPVSLVYYVFSLSL